jgi:NMD protein affecting ribosome stability and mRNA decay
MSSERNNSIRKKKIPSIRKCTQCGNPTRYPYPPSICRTCYENNHREFTKTNKQNLVARKHAGAYRKPGISSKIKQELLDDD